MNEEQMLEESIMNLLEMRATLKAKYMLMTEYDVRMEDIISSYTISITELRDCLEDIKKRNA